jgi:hypothetical protein
MGFTASDESADPTAVPVVEVKSRSPLTVNESPANSLRPGLGPEPVNNRPLTPSLLELLFRGVAERSNWYPLPGSLADRAILVTHVV